MSDTKLKPTSFNRDDENERKLLDAIEESGFNFSKVTKMMWAEKLKFKPKKESKNENN